MLRKSYRWQRDRIVGSTFSGSVVAKMNFTCSGGSSSVLSSALNAALESMCTSSMMYTLNRARAGRYEALAIRSRTLSTPVLDAASISITSMSSPRAMALHDSHFPQGVVVGLSYFSQLRHLARMRAVEVLPVP